MNRAWLKGVILECLYRLFVWSGWNARWSEISWNGADDKRGGAKFFGMERMKREMERFFMKWSG